MEVFLGHICLFACPYAPRGFVECNGQILSVKQHQKLFELLGTTYGGDGRTTFKLPDLRGKELAPNLRYCIYVDPSTSLYPSHS